MLTISNFQSQVYVNAHGVISEQNLIYDVHNPDGSVEGFMSKQDREINLNESSEPSMSFVDHTSVVFAQSNIFLQQEMLKTSSTFQKFMEDLN
jgi:hypothetical protein